MPCIEAPISDLALLHRYARERRPEDRERLFRRHRSLASRLARRYAPRGSADDLEQVAAIGLLNAIDRFDPGRGIAFTSFAVPTILGELRRSFRDTGWSMRVPRQLQERALRVSGAIDALSAERGETPTVHQLAEALELSDEHVLEALEVQNSALKALSLDAADIADGDGTAPLSEYVGEHDPHYELVEDREAAQRVLGCLPYPERTAVQLRFGRDLKQSDIASRMGVSQMQVSRLLSQALARMSSELERSERRRRHAPAAS